MKMSLLALVLCLGTSFAQAGGRYFICEGAESGTIISGNFDEETGALTLTAQQPKKDDKSLEIMSISAKRDKLELEAVEIEGEEERPVYSLYVKPMYKAFYTGTLTTQVGDPATTPPTFDEKAFCAAEL